MEHAQMLEREQAAAQMAAAAAAEKQRSEAAQSAAKLAPWAKKAQAETSLNGGPGSGGAQGGSDHDRGLSMAEIQKLEEERERELQIQREIEEQQLREIRRREEEENAKKQQVKLFEKYSNREKSYVYNGLSFWKNVAQRVKEMI